MHPASSITVPDSHRGTATTANQAELTNFFWHCHVAAKLVDDLPDSTATRSHSLRAVRQATNCWAGKNGVRYASEAAHATQQSLGRPWEQCGFIKEHVIPVSVIHSVVRNELRSIGINSGQLPATGLPNGNFTAQVVGLFLMHPRTLRVATIIASWTLHAWITREEELRFDDKARHGGISIRQRMPKGWREGDDRFARYTHCGITVVPI